MDYAVWIALSYLVIGLSATQEPNVATQRREPKYYGNSYDQQLNELHPNSFKEIDPYRKESQLYNNVGELDNKRLASLGLKDNLLNKKDSKDGSPAMSALALLGFLYFLNYIQDVLDGTNGRKKRDLSSGSAVKFARSTTEILEKIEELPSELTDGETEGRTNSYISSQGRQFVEHWSQDIGSFVRYLFNRVPGYFGFGDMPTSRHDTFEEPSAASSGMWSMFGNRIGLIAKLTDFLSDPQPSRVGRSVDAFLQENESKDSTDYNYANPRELTEKEKIFLPGNAENDYLKRSKRFAQDSNDIWHSDVGGIDRKEDTYDERERLMGIVIELMKKIVW